jgi:predicted enzyme related to lactoylglutathione lyase
LAARIEFLSAVQLVSRDAERLAAFYRDVLGLPLEEERHDAEERYWACTLGELHVSIRPFVAVEDEHAQPSVDGKASSDAERPERGGGVGAGAVKLAFAVIDIDDVVASLEERGVALVYAPRDLGWCKMTAIRDPDGNHVELTELGDDWYRHLEKRDARPAPRRKKKLAHVKRG